MRFFGRKNGFTLVEILAVVAVITVLLSMVIGVGKHVKEQGKIKLTQSTIDILVTATELYYQDENKMPFETTMAVGVDFTELNFDFYLYNLYVAPVLPYTPTMMLDPVTGVHADWSGDALYYFLSKSLNSKRIIAAIIDSQVTTKDDTGNVNITAIVNTTQISPPPPAIDMPRVVDAWGNTIRYRYTTGDTFCLISSPGKDKEYGTNDDITNKN